MAILQHFNFGVNINPPPPTGSQINVNVSPLMLQLFGFNIPVEILTATADRQPPSPLPLNSIIVMAHVDTGASITSIDISLAEHLNLEATGELTNITAGGAKDMPRFAIDLCFPNTKLSPFINLGIGSCNLVTFNIQQCLLSPHNPQNFGILIGRDVLSRWNLVWNGPSSTIIISD